MQDYIDNFFQGVCPCVNTVLAVEASSRIDR